MLAKAVDTVPAADSVRGGLAYEPQWDGFRCLVLRDGDEVELASRGGYSSGRPTSAARASARARLRACQVVKSGRASW